MLRTAIVIAGLLPFAAACGNAGITEPTFADDSSETTAKSKKSKGNELGFLDDMPDTEGGTETSPLAETKVGDLRVQRFSGSFTKTPLTLTEEVIATAGSLVIVDYTLEEGKKTTKLRVTHDKTSDRVLRVREMRGTEEMPSSVSAYEQMLSKTMFLPDDNEAKIGSEKSTCLIGEKEVDCEKTSYRVKVGKQTATFSVAQTSDGKDIGGEISGEDGKLYFRSETVDMRAGSPSNVASR
jgi:hypothetical protein